MARVRTRRAVDSRYGPPDSIRRSLDLRAGPRVFTSGALPFATDADRLDAWQRSREWFLGVAYADKPDDRPEAWWNYEDGIPAKLRWRPRGLSLTEEQELALARLRWLDASDEAA